MNTSTPQSTTQTLWETCPTEIKWAHWPALHGKEKHVAWGAQGRKGSWGAFCRSVEDEASSGVFEKGRGPYFSPVISLDGHRCNESTLAMTMLSLDCDGSGNYTQILDQLEGMGAAYCCYQSGGHTPELPKWRLVLPLSQEFSTSSASGVAAWHAAYLAARDYFGRLAGLTGSGFDPLKSPSYAWYYGHRRTPSAPFKKVFWSDGKALNIGAIPAVPRPAQPPIRLSTPPAPGKTQRLPAKDLAWAAALATGTRVPAPCCGDGPVGHSGAAGTVVSAPGEGVRIFCHRCQLLWLAEPEPFSFTPFPVPPVGTDQEDEEAGGDDDGETDETDETEDETEADRQYRWWHDAPEIETVHGIPVTRICQKYLDSIRPVCRVTYVKSPQNTGKTYGLRDLARTTGSVLTISHRVSLLAKLTADWNLASYQAAPAGEITEKRLGVCINSLHRVQTPNAAAVSAWLDMQLDGNSDGTPCPTAGYELLLWDESEQGVRHTYGGTIKGKYQAGTYQDVERHLQQAKQIVCSDADMSLLTIRAVRRYLGWDLDEGCPGSEELIINDYRAKDKSVVQYQDKADLLAKMQEEWQLGLRLWICCDSKKTAETVAKLLEEWAPVGTGKKVLLVTADTREGARALDLFSSPDTEIKRWDAVVSSPAISTGLSVDATHIDCIYLLLGGGSVTASDGVQMIYRVRNPVNSAIRVWVTKRVVRRCTDPAGIKSDENWLNEDGVKLAIKWNVIDDAPALDPHSPLIWDAWADVEAYNRGGRDNLRAAMTRLCNERGIAEIKVPELDSITRAALARSSRAARKTLTREAAERVAFAAAWTDAEYEDATAPGRKMSMAAKDAAERYRISDFYLGVGNGDVGPDLVLWDNHGKGRQAVQRYISLRLLGEGDHARVMAGDVTAMRYGVASRRTHHAQAAVLLGGLLRAHGLDSLTGGQVVHQPTDKQWGKLDDVRGLVAILCGVAVPSAELRVRHPLAFLAYLLRTVGLALESRKAKYLPRQHSLSGDSVSEMEKMSYAHRCKITGSCVVVMPSSAELEEWKKEDQLLKDLCDQL